MYREDHQRLVDHAAPVTLTQAAELGVSSQALYQLRDEGVVEQISRGVYKLTELDLAHPDLVAVACRAPQAVICLLSGLAFHELTVHIPSSVNLAVRRGRWPPRIDYPPTTVHLFSGTAFDHGIEQHTLDGVPVAIYSPEKCVADAFKFRNQLGVDLAVEALRSWYGAHANQPGRLTALQEAARATRTLRVVRPYLDAVML